MKNIKLLSFIFLTHALNGMQDYRDMFHILSGNAAYVVVDIVNRRGNVGATVSDEPLLFRLALETWHKILIPIIEDDREGLNALLRQKCASKRYKEILESQPVTKSIEEAKQRILKEEMRVKNGFPFFCCAPKKGVLIPEVLWREYLKDNGLEYIKNPFCCIEEHILRCVPPRVVSLSECKYMVKSLLKKGFDINEPGISCTPLGSWCEYLENLIGSKVTQDTFLIEQDNFLRLLEVFLAHGANPNVDPEPEKATFETILDKISKLERLNWIHSPDRDFKASRARELLRKVGAKTYPELLSEGRGFHKKTAVVALVRKESTCSLQ